MKKQYNKPSMEAIEIKNQCMILAGSQTSIPMHDDAINNEQYVW